MERRRHYFRYEQVYDQISSDINSGRFEEMLPPEADLITLYGVSRGTLRVALSQLRDEGLIDRRQGAGTFILRRPPDLPTPSSITVTDLVELANYLRKKVEAEKARFAIIPPSNETFSPVYEARMRAGQFYMMADPLVRHLEGESDEIISGFEPVIFSQLQREFAPELNILQQLKQHDPSLVSSREEGIVKKNVK